MPPSSSLPIFFSSYPHSRQSLLVMLFSFFFISVVCSDMYVGVKLPSGV